MQAVAVGTVFERGFADGEGGEAADLGCEDAAEFGVGIDDEEVVGRRVLQPLGDALADLCGGEFELTGGTEESGDVDVEDLLWG